MKVDLDFTPEVRSYRRYSLFFRNYQSAVSFCKKLCSLIPYSQIQLSQNFFTEGNGKGSKVESLGIIVEFEFWSKPENETIAKKIQKIIYTFDKDITGGYS